MKKIALTLIFILAGCASYGTQVTPQQTRSFEIGKTSRADVIRQLGNPNVVRNKQGEKSIGYTYVKGEADAATFIPLIGAFVGTTTYTGTTTFFTFDAAGKLLSIENEETTGSARFGEQL